MLDCFQNFKKFQLYDNVSDVYTYQSVFLQFWIMIETIKEVNNHVKCILFNNNHDNMSLFKFPNMTKSVKDFPTWDGVIIVPKSAVTALME